MANNQELLNKLSPMLKWKRSKKFYADQLGITEKEVSNLIKEMKPYKKTKSDNRQVKVNVEKGTKESTVICNFEPKTHTQLAKLHKIDLQQYVITNYWTKLLPNGKFTSSIFVKKKTTKDYSPEDFLEFLKSYKSNYKPTSFPQEREHFSKVDVEFSLSDYHLAKKHIDKDNCPELRYTRFINVLSKLVSKTRSVFDINTAVFPISNDFFHTDNYQNQTTNGTPQDTILSYHEEYELGFKILVDSIRLLLANSGQVHVVLVQGNHDRTKSFYMAHALEIFFKDEDRVTFDRTHSVVKGVVLGNTFIGYHHGNCKIEELPLLFATHSEYSVKFGNSIYKEVHTGDKHHYMSKEIKGVRIQQMPSLSGTDRWHLDNNYVHSIRAGLALVYDETKGKCAEFEERI